MGLLKALALAGAAVLGMVNLARAADLLPPPPPVEPIYAAPDFGGWYLRGDIGVGINDLGPMRSSFAPSVFVDNPRFESSHLGTTTILGIGAGYQFNSWFRGDVTGEYRTAAHFSAKQSYGPIFCPAPRCFDDYTASVTSGVFLANGYFDLGTWYGFTPFVGGGVGFASNHIRGLKDYGLPPAAGFGAAADKSAINFAWALMAGFSYSFTPNLKLELGYRYLNLGTVWSNPIICQAGCTFEMQRFKLASHDVRLGVRWMFADYAPPPRMPLVTKY
jgi:opacity protein-like surface antigen